MVYFRKLCSSDLRTLIFCAPTKEATVALMARSTSALVTSSLSRMRAKLSLIRMILSR